MTQTLQNILGAAVAGLVAALVVLHFAPVHTVTNTVTAGSPAGSTFNTAKTAAIVFAPISNTASTTSVYNGDSSDRIIKDAHITCTGANFTAANSLAQVTFSAATTAVASLGLQNNPRLALSTTVATSAAEVYVATSSQNTIARRWNSGSYLTFLTNATSTGMSCVVGVDYIAT